MWLLTLPMNPQILCATCFCVSPPCEKFLPSVQSNSTLFHVNIFAPFSVTTGLGKKFFYNFLISSLYTLKGPNYILLQHLTSYEIT